MKFEDHLREFLDNTIDDAEARELAVAAVAGSLRQIKLGVAERLWQARQLGADDPKSSAAALGVARLLKVRYDAAHGEYDRLAGVPRVHPEGLGLQVIGGGRSDSPEATGTMAASGVTDGGA